MAAILKGFHGAVLCTKYPSGEQDIRTLYLTFFNTEIIEILYYERSERRKNQYFGINEHCYCNAEVVGGRACGRQLLVSAQ